MNDYIKAMCLKLAELALETKDVYVDTTITFQFHIIQQAIGIILATMTIFLLSTILT